MNGVIPPAPLTPGFPPIRPHTAGDGQVPPFTAGCVTTSESNVAVSGCLRSCAMVRRAVSRSAEADAVCAARTESATWLAAAAVSAPGDALRLPPPQAVEARATAMTGRQGEVDDMVIPVENLAVFRTRRASLVGVP